MIFGKTLRVFAATLIFTSSISFAGEGTGTNNTSKAPAGGALNPTAFFPSVQTTETLADGSVENVSVEMETVTSEAEAQQLSEHLNLEVQKNIKLGGHPSVLLINPDQPLRTWMADAVPYTSVKGLTLAEKELGKTWNDKANELATKALNQIRPDGKFGERVKEFKTAYIKDISTFYRRGSADGTVKAGKGFDKFNITVSIIRMSLNSGVPFLVAVASHGLHNVAPQVAFMPYLALGMMSGIVFTYLSPFIPWNRELPKLADTAFWTTADLLVQETLYYLSEGLFVEGFRNAQMLSNKWALSRNESPQYKVMTEGENWKIISPLSSAAQSPYDISFGTSFKEGNKKLDAMLAANPELAPQIEASRTKLLNMLALKGTIVSVLITIAGLVGGPHSFISEVGFTWMYLGAAVTFATTFDLPEKFATFVESLREHSKPESIKLPRFTNEEIAESCASNLATIK